MENFPFDLALLAGLLVANRTVMQEVRRRAIFWAFQAVNLAAAAWFALVGIAGLEAFPIARWLVAGLLVFHAVQNVAVFLLGRPKV